LYLVLDSLSGRVFVSPELEPDRGVIQPVNAVAAPTAPIAKSLVNPFMIFS
jgi:hypothetical protein